MNDFETVRDALPGKLHHYENDPYAALDRIEAEIEKLREWKVSAEVAHEQNQGLVAEVERQRAHNRDFQAAWATAKKGLSAANREVERLQRLVAAYEDIELVKEVEQLRDELLVKQAALDLHGRENHGLLREVERLRAALEELAHPTMDAHELAHLDDFHQGDIETARAALGER